MPVVFSKLHSGGTQGYLAIKADHPFLDRIPSYCYIDRECPHLFDPAYAWSTVSRWQMCLQIGLRSSAPRDITAHWEQHTVMEPPAHQGLGVTERGLCLHLSANPSKQGRFRMKARKKKRVVGNVQRFGLPIVAEQSAKRARQSAELPPSIEAMHFLANGSCT